MIFELFEDTVKMVFIVWLVFIQAHVMVDVSCRRTSQISSGGKASH